MPLQMLNYRDDDGAHEEVDKIAGVLKPSAYVRNRAGAIGSSYRTVADPATKQCERKGSNSPLLHRRSVLAGKTFHEPRRRAERAEAGKRSRRTDNGKAVAGPLNEIIQ
jgi:hypothetical protein